MSFSKALKNMQINKKSRTKIFKTILFLVFCSIIYRYWDEIGIFFIENILVIDVGTVAVVGKAATKSVVAKKTFLSLVKKVGYKKLFVSIFWVIFKRFLIDQVTLYFKKHSLKRFKRNLIEVVELKLEEIKNTTVVKKVLAFVSLFVGGSFFYYFLTSYLGKILIGILQKIFYVLILFLGKFITLVFGLTVFVFTSIIQIFFVVKLINYIEKFWIIKSFYSIVTYIFRKILNIIDFAFGTKIHLNLIKLSRRIDSYLASILDKNFSAYEVVQRKRDRFINSYEYLSIQRERYILKKREQNSSTVLKYYDKFLKKYIKKEKTWKEKRVDYKNQKEQRYSKKRKRLRREVRRNKLLLPNRNYSKPY